jgi:hypothetical protein
MPSPVTLRRWVLGITCREVPDSFRERHRQARECQAEVYFDEVFDLADDLDATDHVGVHKARLQVGSRKWVLAKMNRVKFGESKSVEVRGDPERPPSSARSFAAQRQAAIGFEEAGSRGHPGGRRARCVAAAASVTSRGHTRGMMESNSEELSDLLATEAPPDRLVEGLDAIAQEVWTLGRGCDRDEIGPLAQLAEALDSGVDRLVRVLQCLTEAIRGLKEEG